MSDDDPYAKPAETEKTVIQPNPRGRRAAIGREESAVRLALEERKHGIRVHIIVDRVLLIAATFVLAVRADMPAEALRRAVSRKIKIGPVEQIRELVNLGLPGIQVRALPSVPRQLPDRKGTAYFELEQTGVFWKQMMNSLALVIYSSSDFRQTEMELWAVARQVSPGDDNPSAESDETESDRIQPNPGGCRAALERVSSGPPPVIDPGPNAVQLHMEERKYGIRVHLITDRSLLAMASLVLAVKADMQAEVFAPLLSATGHTRPRRAYPRACRHRAAGYRRARVASRAASASVRCRDCLLRGRHDRIILEAHHQFSGHRHLLFRFSSDADGALRNQG
jgi:hypothetical protein